MATIKQNQSGFEKLKKLAGVSLMRAIKVYPPKVHFDGQDTQERIILFLRQHPIVLVPVLFRGVLIIVGGLFLTFIFGIMAANSGFDLQLTNIVLVTLSFVFGLGLMFFEFLKWYYTVFIITTSRLVDLDFLTLFNATLSSTLLEDIQDVSHSTPGFFSTLFDMGSIEIQTASEKNRFEISNIPKPRDVQDILMDLLENVEKNGSNL